MNHVSILLNSPDPSWSCYSESLICAFMSLRLPTCYTSNTPTLVDQIVLGNIESWSVIPNTMSVVGISDIIRIPLDQFSTQCNQADCIVFPSHVATIPYLESGIGKPFFVIPFGVGPLFSPSVRDIPNMLSMPFTFLFSAPMDGFHGAEIAASAFCTSFDNNPDVRLVMHDELCDNTSQFIQLRSKYTSSNIFWLSNQDKTKIMQLSHCFVYPSCENDFGHSVYQALHSGVPVIASRTASLSEHLNTSDLLFLDMSNSYIDRSTIDSRYIGTVRLPRSDALIHYMRKVVEESSTYLNVAKEKALHLDNTWKKTARYIVACVIEARNLREF